MKRMKIASLLTAVAMLASSFTMMAFAATKTGNETLTVDAVEIDWTDSAYADYADFNYGEDYDYYMLTYSVKGVSVATTVGSGLKKNKATGSAINAVSIQTKTTPNAGALGEDYLIESVYPYVSGSSSYTIDVTNGNNKATSYGATSMLYPASGTAGTITEADETVVYKAIAIVTPGTELKIDFDGSSVAMADFVENGYTANSGVEAALKTTSITVPAPAATATPTPTPVVTEAPTATPTVEPTPEVTPEPVAGVEKFSDTDAAAWAWETAAVAGSKVKVTVTDGTTEGAKTFDLNAAVEGSVKVGVIVQYNPTAFPNFAIVDVEIQ